MKTSEFATMVKTITRPILVIMLAIAWIGFIAHRIDVPIAYEGVAGGAITWYFAERSYKRVKEIRRPK